MTVQPVDYGRFVAMAERLLIRWGQVGQLLKPTTTGPATNPTEGDPATTDARFAVVEFRSDLIDGTRIKSSDREIYMSPVGLGFAPSTQTEVVEAVGGKPWKVIAVETVKPASVVCLYVLHCRR